MNQKLTRWSVGLCGVLLFVGGCGMPDVSALKKKLGGGVKTAMKPKKPQHSIRSGDYEDTNPFAKSESKKAAAASAGGERRADLDLAMQKNSGTDATYIESSLEGELGRLREQARLQKEKLSELLSRRQEIDGMISRYDQQYDATSRRIQSTQRVMSVIETDPAFFTRESQRVHGQPERAAPVQTAPVLDDFVPSPGARSASGNSAMAPAAGWNEPLPKTHVTLPTAPAATNAQSGRFARPPFAANTSAPAPVTTAPASSSKSSKILACSGTGSDAVAILGVGLEDGVTVGSYYAVGDNANPRAVLVVTEVYRSMARAVPVPGKLRGDLAMQDTVRPIHTLP